MTAGRLVPVATPTLAAYDPGDTLEAAIPALELATKLAKTEFVPAALRGKPEAVMAAILTGRELGVGAMQALRGIYVIEGRPTLAAELQRALILRAGHTLRTIEHTRQRATLAGIRAGEDYEHRATFDLGDAERAGIARKANWQRYPGAMVYARATSKLAREHFPDVCFGLYAPEDFDEHPVDLEALAVDAEPEAAPPKRRRAPKTERGAAPGAPAPAKPKAATKAPRPPAPAPPLPHELEADEDVVDAELVEEAPATIGTVVIDEPAKAATERQRLRLYALRVGIDDDLRHGLINTITEGRTATSTELTDAELAEVRDVIDRVHNGTRHLVYDRAGDVVIAPIDTDRQPEATPATEPVHLDGAVPDTVAAWKAVADGLGINTNALLLRARTVATLYELELPVNLTALAANPALGRHLLDELDPPF